MHISLPDPFSCNKCAIMVITGGTGQGLPDYNKKVFADMTASVRYRTVGHLFYINND